MVRSALKLRTFAEEYTSSSNSREFPRETLPSSPKTTPARKVLHATPPVNPPPTLPPLPPPPPVIRFLIDMVTPNELAAILRARVARLVSQWPQYMSQPPTLLHHGLPSPSSSGSPLVQQQNQTGKKLDLATIHSFVAFFYPDDHQIHRSIDISSETLLAHLEGLQTLLSFLSSKELGVIIKNRLISSSPHRSASIHAVVEVIRHLSPEDEESEDLDSIWKQLWLKTSTTTLPSPQVIPLVPSRTLIDVAVATESGPDALPITMAMASATSIPSMRISSSDGARPLKRPKFVASHPIFQDSTDDSRTGISLPPSNPPINDAIYDHSHTSGSTSITMSIPIPKMADPILRPVSTRSFKSPPITLPLEDDGEADAEGDTDTDIDMDVDLAVDVSERSDDKAAVNTLMTSHSLSKGSIGSRFGTPSEGPTIAIPSAAVMAPSPSLTSVNYTDTSNVLPPSTRHCDIPKGPRAMRSLLSNESTYSISSGSRTPSISNVNTLSHISPPNTITTSAAMTPITTLQAKQEAMSGEWGLITRNTELKESGTRQCPIEIADQKIDLQQLPKEAASRRIVSVSFPVKSTVPPAKKPQGIHNTPSPTQSVFTMPRDPPLSSTSSSIFSIPKSTNTTPLRYEGPELPPYDEVMPSNISSKATSDTTIAISALAQSRSKPGRRNKKANKSPSRFSGRSQKSISRSRTSSSPSRSRSADEKRHRLPKKKSLSTKYEIQSSTRKSVKHSHSHSQSDKRAWDSSSRSSSCSTDRSRSESRSRAPYRPRNYSYSRPPSPSSSKDRHWSPEPSRRRERGRSRSRRRRGDENPPTSRTSNGMDHWSPGRDSRRGDTDTTTRSSNIKSRSGRA